MARTKKTTEVVVEQNSEVRKFKMHPDLLFSVIKSQAGTQEKAILEAVMNAVDAGATRCDITINENGYNISDDGKGFASRQEVDEFFETFGTPHKEGDATYGRFRMGRGQLFAFSSTVWKTTTFEMHVDIQKSGLDYVFKENMPFATGCSIIGTWYKKMATQELFVMIKELEYLIKFMQIPVYVNGKDLSVDASKQKWDYKENDFFVKVSRNSSTLSVYNMGALVSHYPAARFGVAGIVVTKSSLKVNFARNDVLTSECALWKKITKKMKEIMGVETAKKNVLTDAEREAILNDIISQETFVGSVLQKGLLMDISGKKISFKTLLDAKRITFSTGNQNLKKVEERVHDRKMALVLAESNLQKFYVKTPEQFVNCIQKLIEFNNKESDILSAPYSNSRDAAGWAMYSKYRDLKIYGEFNPDLMDINELISSINNESDIIEEDKLNKKELIFLKAAREINGWVGRMVFSVISPDDKNSWEKSKKFERSLCLGKSEVFGAWTDGTTYIALEIKNLTAHPMKIVHLLVHEYCHNIATLESHDHGSEFYEAYHDVIKHNSENIFLAALHFQKAFNKIMLKEGVKPKKVFDENIKVVDDFSSMKDHEFESQIGI